MLKGLTSRTLNFLKAQKLMLLSLFVIPLFFAPYLQSSFVEGKEALLKVLILLSLFLIGLSVYKQKTWNVRNVEEGFLFKLLFLQILIHALSDFFSSSNIVSLYGTFSRGGGLIMELYLFTFLIVVSSLCSKDELRQGLRWTWVAGVVVAIYAVLQKLGLEFFFKNYATTIFDGRVFSFLGNPSLLGQFMMMTVIIGAHLLFTSKTKVQAILYAVGTIGMATVLLMSGTRSAVLGLLILGLAVALKHHRQLFTLIWKNKKRGLLVLPIILLGIHFAPTDRFSFSTTAFRSLFSRFEIWKGAVQLIGKSPWLGYGQETFYIHSPEILSKEFLTLEENINIGIDRVHNETLEEIYEHGVPAGLLYLFTVLYLTVRFFKTKSQEETVFLGLFLANTVQNQLSFPDITLALVATFCLAGGVACEKEEMKEVKIKMSSKKRTLLIAALSLSLCAVAYWTLVKPLIAQRFYTESKPTVTTDYEEAVTRLKTALTWAPYYGEWWYELMMLDPSSMERALFNLTILEGDSGNVLAWKGNYYAESNPELSADYFLKALALNPNHPNWIQAFAKMAMDHGDCTTALYLYAQYLEAIPDYWKWTDVESMTEKQQKSYRGFFKTAPYLYQTFEKIDECEEQVTSNLEPTQP